MTIGEMISARRKELGLTLEEVGKAVGVGKSTVKKWESGYIANMKRDKIAALSEILKISPTEFINAEPTEQDIKANPNTAFHEFLKENYGDFAVQALELFGKLDTLDQGRAIGSMEEMLKNEKYSISKESSGKKAM